MHEINYAQRRLRCIFPGLKSAKVCRGWGYTGLNRQRAPWNHANSDPWNINIASHRRISCAVSFVGYSSYLERIRRVSQAAGVDRWFWLSWSASKRKKLWNRWLTRCIGSLAISPAPSLTPVSCRSSMEGSRQPMRHAAVQKICWTISLQKETLKLSWNGSSKDTYY